MKNFHNSMQTTVTTNWKTKISLLFFFFEVHSLLFCANVSSSKEHKRQKQILQMNPQKNLSQIYVLYTAKQQ